MLGSAAMTWLEAVFLGVVQGLTEFLPVSSSGHLVVFQHFLGIKEGQLTFDILVHVGTLLTVVTIYRVELFELLRGAWQGLREKTWNDSLKMVFFVLLASLPTGLMGIFLRDYWSSTFAALHWVGVFLCVTGFLLLLTKKKSEDEEASGFGVSSLGSLNWRKALIIGVAQGLAILPGVSRAGTTIAVALLLGIERKTAAFYSFLLMMPAVAGASILELSEVRWEEAEVFPLAMGFLAAYFSGLLGLKFVLSTVKKGRLEVFSPYLWCLGGGLLIYAISQ